MRISWGIKIAALYSAFAILIICLVVASTRQHFDLVSTDYYSKEIGYQKVIDASKNQSALSQPISIHANESAVVIDFPYELKGNSLSGSIYFYSAVRSSSDKQFAVKGSNSISIPRSSLDNVAYTVKVDIDLDGKKYYQESALNLYTK